MRTITICWLVASLLLGIEALASNSNYKSDCFPEHPLIRQLQPWLSKVDAQIVRTYENDDRDKRFIAKFLTNHDVACNFVVLANGEVRDVNIFRTSGIKRLDRCIIELIQLAAPFDSPPNELPTKAGIALTFAKISGRIQPISRPRLVPGMLHVGQFGGAPDGKQD